MAKIRTLWLKVKGQATQAREDEVFDEEVREHIALLEKRYQAQGMSIGNRPTRPGASSGTWQSSRKGRERSAEFFRLPSGRAMCNLGCGCWRSDRC